MEIIFHSRFIGFSEQYTAYFGFYLTLFENAGAECTFYSELSGYCTFSFQSKVFNGLSSHSDDDANNQQIG